MAAKCLKWWESEKTAGGNNESWSGSEADLEASCARWNRRALMCRQADYLQPDCLLFSDKCSAINEFCVTRRSANVAVAMATGTADPNRLSRGEKETSRTVPTEVGLSSAAGCWLVERCATVLCYVHRHRWGQERLSEEHTDESGSGVPGPGAPPLQGQIGVKSLCPGGLSLFALRSRVEPRTKQLPHVPPGSQRRTFEAWTGRRWRIFSANLC